MNETPYTHPSMPTDDFPKHVLRTNPPLPRMRPVPVTAPDWSGMNPMPVTVTPPEPLEPYYNMVQLPQPTYFQTVFAESLKQIAEARASEQVTVWLEEIIDDPEGRKLVQGILDRKAATVIHQGMITDVSIDVDGLGNILLGGEED